MSQDLVRERRWVEYDDAVARVAKLLHDYYTTRHDTNTDARCVCAEDELDCHHNAAVDVVKSAAGGVLVDWLRTDRDELRVELEQAQRELFDAQATIRTLIAMIDAVPDEAVPSLAPYRKWVEQRAAEAPREGGQQ